MKTVYDVPAICASDPRLVGLSINEAMSRGWTGFGNLCLDKRFMGMTEEDFAKASAALSLFFPAVGPMTFHDAGMKVAAGLLWELLTELPGYDFKSHADSIELTRITPQQIFVAVLPKGVVPHLPV